MRFFSILKSNIVIFTLIFAQFAFSESKILDGVTLKSSTLSDLMMKVTPGTVLILGENHNISSVSQEQLTVLQLLKEKGLTVSVGMEFFNYTDQEKIQNYRLGMIDEEKFKTEISWGGYDFNLYKNQLLFPQATQGEFGLGINLSRSVTSAISKGGLEQLSEEHRIQLPPQFTLGRDSYRKRFFDLMGVTHPTPKLENYFVAQCAWDDTMAWQSVEFMSKNPNHVFVIIVGEFHAQFGGGLQDRIRARMNEKGINHPVLVMSQISTEGMTEQDIQNEIKPSETEGPRADFISLH